MFLWQYNIVSFFGFKNLSVVSISVDLYKLFVSFYLCEIQFSQNMFCVTLL